MTAQEQITLAGIVCSTCVGLSGLVFAGYTQWIAYKNRTAFYQGKLYDEQLKVYAELMKLAVACRSNTMSCVLDTSEGQFTKFKDTFREFSAKVFQYEHILPNDILTVAFEFKARVFIILRLEDTWSKNEERQSFFINVMISMEFLSNAIREHIGIEKLTAKNVELIGKQRELTKNQTRAFDALPIIE